MLRDNIHFVPIVFEIAARVVQFLGPFKFSALHVRRNDLQYKEVFMNADKTLENISPVLKPNEVLYIATDEKDPRFFAAFEEKHKIFQWKDFFTEKGGYVLKGVKIPRKLEGCIEQAICAMGRIFAGTMESTFSSYIFRLRGYIANAAKNKEWDVKSKMSTDILFHTLAYTGNVEQDRKITFSHKPPKGQIYLSEHPSIWEDVELDKTYWEDPNNLF